MTNTLYEKLLVQKGNLPPLRVAVVNPIDLNSLGGVMLALKSSIINPILIGKKSEIQKVADENDYDISNCDIYDIDVPIMASKKAVELVQKKEAFAIMKGNIDTQTFMRPIVRMSSGLHDVRRMSHIFAFSTSLYHKPLFLTDAAINIAPELFEKKEIIENAIEFFRIIGFGVPKVAILSATEKIHERIESTKDAAILTKMANRGQIYGGIIDGPLAFDNAVSKDSIKIKNIKSDVAGDADILVVPNIEAGNMVYKQLHYLFGVEVGGLVIGGKAPIILNSRATPAGLSQNISIVMASLYAYLKNEYREHENYYF